MREPRRMVERSRTGRRLAWYAGILLVTANLNLAAADTPAQFTAWGTRGPALAPVKPGWTEIPAEPRKRTLPQPTGDETAQGFILFQRRPQEYIYADTVPAWHERDVKLQTFMTQGEYEPLTFAFHALTDLTDCEVKVSTWKTAAGDILPANHIDVRVVRSVRSQKVYRSRKDKRYFLQPFLLEKQDRFAVAKGKTAQVWLTVKAPDDAKPGDYVGSVSVQAAGKTAAKIPVLLRILPFRLPPIPIGTKMSYARPAKDPAIREKEMIDQREHGMNATEAGCGAHVVSRDKDFGDDDVAATKKAIKEALALRRKVFGKRRNHRPVTAEVGHQIAYYWDRSKNWFSFWPYSEKIENDFCKAIRVVEETVKAEGEAAPRIFVIDEPGGNPNMVHAVHYNKLVKEKFPHLKTWVTIGGGTSMGVDEIGMLAPCIDIYSTNRFSVDILKRFLALGKEYEVYNGGSSAESIGPTKRDRYFFGFYAWKTGARGILQWVYFFGNPWRDPIRGNHGYAYTTTDGPIPSIVWESVREGIDDYRYMDLLWRLITVARVSGDDKAKAAAEKGNALTREIMAEIDFDYQAVATQTPAHSPATMEKWRWKVAAACLDLLKHVPLDKALATPAKRPKPLDLPFPEKETTAAQIGAELLPNGGFEGEVKPWKHSAKGTGAVATDAHHGGGKSFKLINGPEATDKTVNVCIWGWGGPLPTMTLEAGKTYEFSAWVKFTGTMPKLRFTLPKGAATNDVRGAAERTPDGWVRLYWRMTMKQDAKPKDMAVWLQGPGTVWCDDLSLRQVQVRPFVLEADQHLMDATDDGVVVRVKQIGGNKAVQVKVQLPDDQVKTVTVPPSGQTEVEFNGAKLALGSHVVKAELVAGDFSQTLAFKRIRGAFGN